MTLLLQLHALNQTSHDSCRSGMPGVIHALDPLMYSPPAWPANPHFCLIQLILDVIFWTDLHTQSLGTWMLCYESQTLLRKSLLIPRVSILDYIKQLFLLQCIHWGYHLPAVLTLTVPGICLSCLDDILAGVVKPPSHLADFMSPARWFLG